MRKAITLALIAALLAGCAAQPIEKTNCWATLGFADPGACASYKDAEPI